MKLLEELAAGGTGKTLPEYASLHSVDERTIRRDIDHLQDIVASIQRIELRRGRVLATNEWHSSGYFGQQVDRNRDVKMAIAREIAGSISDNQALAITAGSTPFLVARELRRLYVESDYPRNLTVFTNSLPALFELISAGISTGIVGEVFNSDDCAFHSPEYRSQFQPGMAIVGASGIVANPVSGLLELYSHRSEESYFLRQLLQNVPEIIVASDGDKLGKRHPWSFTGNGLFTGKSVKLVTSNISIEQQTELEDLVESAPKAGYRFSYTIVTTD